MTLTPFVATGTAAFATLDTTTEGNWHGVYGSNGYNVINGTVAYPSYVTVTPSGTNATTWASSTTDVRALYTSATSTSRIAATWFSNSSFLIDLVFNDGQQHRVALYCLDWDTTKRAETVAIQDAHGVPLASTQNVSNFHNGEYLVWQLSGHVQIRVANISGGGNAVVSGLFFDTTAPAGGYTLTGPSGGTLNTASSKFTVTPNSTYNGTITITPSGGGLSTAIVLTFSNSAASQTFTITPTAVGPVTLTPSNSGSSDQSISPELCDTTRSTDHRNSDGRQWTGHGIVHGSGEHGWVSNHELQSDVWKSECERNSQSDHGDWSEQWHFLHLHNDGKQCFWNQRAVGRFEHGNANFHKRYYYRNSDIHGLGHDYTRQLARCLRIKWLQCHQRYGGLSQLCDGIPVGYKRHHLGELDHGCAGAVHFGNQHEPHCSHLVQHFFLPDRSGIQ